MEIKDYIQGNASFSHYRKGNLYYFANGLLFPVPIEDTRDATFFREDKAILFMRYIRKFLEDSEKQTT